MKRFRRQVRRNARRKVLERMTARQQAEENVFRFLEWRWKDKLRGQKIPEAHRKIMRRDPYFNMLVAKVLQGEGLALPDRDFTPEIEQAPDGTVTNLFEKELAGDPRLYYCIECDEVEVDRVGELCRDCRNLVGDE